MNANQRQQAVVDLVVAGQLQAARQLAQINTDILLDEINAFNQRTDELRKMLAQAIEQRDSWPKVEVGSKAYHDGLRVLASYRQALEDRGMYEAVVEHFLYQLKPSAIIN